MYIDTHCHLSKNDYTDINKIINEAKENNVTKLIISGCDKESIQEAVDIASKYENIFLSLGFHPSEANYIAEEDINELKKIIKNNKKVVAVGEIGLDYHWEKDNKEKQKALFRKMISIAKELELPIVVHSRDSFQDTYDILKGSHVNGVIHCFSGNKENANMYINIGFLLGIGGVITFKNTNLKEVIKELDLKNIVLETDSPYLAPTPYRGFQNEPKYIPIIANEIAKLKNTPVDIIAEITTKNAEKIFNI